jgi:hypothetical protein
MFVHVHSEKGDDLRGVGTAERPFKTLLGAFDFILVNCEQGQWRIKYWLWKEERWEQLL